MLAAKAYHRPRITESRIHEIAAILAFILAFRPFAPFCSRFRCAFGATSSPLRRANQALWPRQPTQFFLPSRPRFASSLHCSAFCSFQRRVAWLTRACCYQRTHSSAFSSDDRDVCFLGSNFLTRLDGFGTFGFPLVYFHHSPSFFDSKAVEL